MPKIHFLNVGNGDCTILQSMSDRVSVIDVCNGNASETDHDPCSQVLNASRKPPGNFQMCSHLTNPIDYLKDIGVSSIFRFILSHPDMDHMDGLDQLMNRFSVLNYWDTGVRRDKPDFSSGGYEEKDWKRYKKIIDGNETDLSVLKLRAGSRNKYWGSDDNNGGGDYLSIVAPDQELVDQANDSGDINDSSYVIVYRSEGGKIIIPGDSHDKTWDFILANYRSEVEDASILIAPHHGRTSSRKHDFLDVVKPKVTLFGCAPSKDLDYSGWRNRDLLYFTNNQCGNVVMEPCSSGVDLYVQNGRYAENYVGNTKKKNDQGYFFLHQAPIT